MLKFNLAVLISMLLISFFPQAYAVGWEKIEIPDNVSTILDDDGRYKDIKPGCAFSHLPDEAGLPNKPFHFYYRKGTKAKTLIYFNGGGACWNGATCLASLTVPVTQTTRPAYNPSVENENNPEELGGILDFTRADNPLKDWNMVFIPYCTGDAHLGSKNEVYVDPSGIINHGGPVLVQHRGFDNFMTVREWLKHRADRPDTEQVLVAGSSAGAYGALMNFPRLHSIYPGKTKISLLSDAGTGVFTSNFLDTVFEPDGAWGTEHTLATWIPGINRISSYNTLNFFTSLATGIERHFANSRFAYVTTAWDDVQMLFLNIMRKTGQGVNDPNQWFNLTPVTAVEWSLRMLTTLHANALINSNSKYYISAGTYHVGLVDVFAPGVFYTEKSAGGIYLKDWVNRLVTDDRKYPLINLMCSGTCGAPFPP